MIRNMYFMQNLSSKSTSTCLFIYHKHTIGNLRNKNKMENACNRVTADTVDISTRVI